MNILLIGYSTIGLLAWRPLAGHFAWQQARHYGQKKPEIEDWAHGAFFGGIASALWPLGVIWGIGSVLPKVGAERKGPIGLPTDPHYIRQLEKSTLDPDDIPSVDKRSF